MIMSNFIDGLNILKKYFNEDGFQIGADHDEFYVYSTDLPISPDDLETLYSLDWAQIGIDPGVENYDVTESWRAYM